MSVPFPCSATGGPLRGRRGTRCLALALLAGATPGCEDVVAEQSWTSFSVVEIEANEPDAGPPVPGVTVLLRALGTTCDALHPGAVPADSVSTGADGRALLGVSVESGPVGAACLGLEVRAPVGHALEGPVDRAVPVSFVIRGQQPPGRLAVVLVPDPAS